MELAQHDHLDFESYSRTVHMRTKQQGFDKHSFCGTLCVSPRLRLDAKREFEVCLKAKASCVHLRN